MQPDIHHGDGGVSDRSGDSDSSCSASSSSSSSSGSGGFPRSGSQRGGGLLHSTRIFSCTGRGCGSSGVQSPAQQDASMRSSGQTRGMRGPRTRTDVPSALHGQRRYGGRCQHLIWCTLLLASCATAAGQQCNMTIGGLIRTFGEAGTGANANADFGFLPDPQNVPDLGIVASTLSPGSNGRPQYAPVGTATTPTTHGTSSFADWWTRLPTTTAAMTLVQTSDGSSFAFTSANLYPIPGEPWYTMEWHTQLTYLAASAGVIKFAFNCDLFVFLNGQLLVNLGGIHALETQTIDLTTLDLQDGAVYQLDLFAAQRHQSDPSQFQLLTTVDFVSGEAVSALCAGGPPTISSGNLTEPAAPPLDGFPGAAGCNVLWQVGVGDSCSSIAVGSGLEGAAQLQGLNSGLDCADLSPGQLLCTGVSPTATCGIRVFTTSGSDTCLSIRTAFGTNGMPIPFSLFGALNNGLDCGPDGTTALPANLVLCLPVVIGGSAAAPAPQPILSGRRLAASVSMAGSAVPLPGDGFAAVLGLEAAARYDVADQMGLDSFSADTAGAAAMPGADSAPQWAGGGRRLQQSGASSCIGTTFTVASTGSCALTCSSVAASVGLTALQLTVLNTQLTANSQGVCKVSLGQTLCRGCTGTVCGVALSQPLQDFLNFPNLNLLFCGLLADCSNVAFTSGTVGEVSEQLTITLDAPTASSDALIAAGDATPAAFFAADGYYNTAPGSTLSLVIQPNYYDAIVTGGSEGLISWQADVVLPPGDTGGSSRRRLQDSKSASEQGPDSFQLGSIDTFGDSPGRRQLQSFPLPGTRGYPKSAYKVTSQNPKTQVRTYYRRIY